MFPCFSVFFREIVIPCNSNYTLGASVFSDKYDTSSFKGYSMMCSLSCCLLFLSPSIYSSHLAHANSCALTSNVLVWIYISFSGTFMVHLNCFLILVSWYWIYHTHNFFLKTQQSLPTVVIYATNLVWSRDANFDLFRHWSTFIHVVIVPTVGFESLFDRNAWYALVSETLALLCRWERNWELTSSFLTSPELKTDDLLLGHTYQNDQHVRIVFRDWKSHFEE